MLYSTFNTPVNATTERIWNFLLDKMERPQRYIPYEVEEFKIWERYDDGILREIKTSEMHMTTRFRNCGFTWISLPCLPEEVGVYM